MNPRQWSEIMKYGFSIDDIKLKEMAEPPLNANEMAWAVYVERAVHVNEPDFRRIFAEMVGEKLLSGDQIPIVMREWLAYVIGHLLEKDTIPHEGKGRKKKSLSESVMETQDLMLSLARQKSDAALGVVKRLELAANDLNWSFEKTRALYYKPGFQDALRTFSEGSSEHSRNLAAIFQNDLS